VSVIFVARLLETKKEKTYHNQLWQTMHTTTIKFYHTKWRRLYW